MFSEFKVKDFKGYVDENYFNFSGLTILCGTNNSGKSSLLQSVYLLSQNINTEIPSLPLNNINFKSGTFSDILYKEKTNKDTVEFGITFNKSILNKDQIERLYVNFIFKNPAALEKVSLPFGEPVLTAIEIEFQKKGDNIKNLDINLIDRTGNSLYKVDGESEKGYISMEGLVPSPIIYSDIDRQERRIASGDYELICSYLRLINRKNIHYLKAYRVDDYRQSFTSGKSILGISGEYTAEFIGNKWNSHTGYCFVDILNFIGKTELLTYLNNQLQFKNIEEVFNFVQQEIENIIILNSAWKSSRKHDFRSLCSTVYFAIMGLEDTELEMILQSRNEVDRKKVFLDKYHLEISGETSTTLKSRVCSKARTFDVAEHGEQLFEWHIKLDGNRTRIHYWVDKINKKVYIGHCGAHLPTSG